MAQFAVVNLVLDVLLCSYVSMAGIWLVGAPQALGLLPISFYSWKGEIKSTTPQVRQRVM